MLEVSNMMGEKDSENKKFITILAGMGAGTLVAGILALASSLGANAQIESNDDLN